MLHIKSMIDGFKVIIGGGSLNSAMSIALLISIGFKPPTYEDDETRTELVLYTFWFLYLYHSTMLVVSMCLHRGYVTGSITTWIMLVVITIVLLCQRCIYSHEYDDDFDLMSDKQKVWYIWCWVEEAYFFSTIIGAVLFTFVRTWIPVT